MENFVKIAEGLEVSAALAELGGQPEHVWLRLNPDASRYIPLLDHGRARRLEAELPETWRLIDAVRAVMAAEHDDHGALSHARVGLMPPGEGLPPHHDGIDGVTERRYQLALQSAPGVVLTVGGETRCPRPGEAWRIAAERTHMVANGSDIDRITILFDTKG